MTNTFLRHPGLSGPFGALMDEYARAAEDFCRVVETFDRARFDAERPSNNRDTVSPRAICLHVIGAAHRYAYYIRKARGVDFVERYDADPAQLRWTRIFVMRRPPRLPVDHNIRGSAPAATGACLARWAPKHAPGLFRNKPSTRQ